MAVLDIMPTDFFRACVIAILAVHLAWILWVMFGWILAIRRLVLRWLHIASLVYSIFIEVAPVSCPLTLAEQVFERRAGIEPYHQPFLVHLLETAIYPNISPTLLVSVAVAYCIFFLAFYVWLFRPHRATAHDAPKKPSPPARSPRPGR